MEELTPEEQAFLDQDKATSPAVVADEPDEPEQEAPEAEAREEDQEAPAEPAPAKPPEGFVPQGALHAERQKRKEEQAVRKQLEERLAALEARIPKQEPAPEPEIPDPVMEPEKFRAFYKQQMQAQERARQQDEQQRQQQQRAQQVASFVQRSEQQFVAATPDYQDAVNHLSAARQAELTAQGYAPEQIQQIMRHDINGIVQNAMQQGKNPAQIAYDLAKLRGYQPKQQEAERITALATAQKQAGTIGAAGAPANGKLTIKQLAEMSPEDMAKLSDKEFQEVMGG